MKHIVKKAARLLLASAVLICLASSTALADWKDVEGAVGYQAYIQTNGINTQSIMQNRRPLPDDSQDTEAIAAWTTSVRGGEKPYFNIGANGIYSGAWYAVLTDVSPTEFPNLTPLYSLAVSDSDTPLVVYQLDTYNDNCAVKAGGNAVVQESTAVSHEEANEETNEETQEVTVTYTYTATAPDESLFIPPEDMGLLGWYSSDNKLIAAPGASFEVVERPEGGNENVPMVLHAVWGMTRASFAAKLTQVRFGDTLEQEYDALEANSVPSDCGILPSDTQKAIVVAVGKGFIHTKGDGTLGQGEAVTRKEAALMLYRSGLNDADASTALPTDCSELEEVYQPAIRAVLAAGMMKTAAEGAFVPDANIKPSDLVWNAYPVYTMTVKNRVGDVLANFAYLYGGTVDLSGYYQLDQGKEDAKEFFQVGWEIRMQYDYKQIPPRSSYTFGTDKNVEAIAYCAAVSDSGVILVPNIDWTDVTSLYQYVTTYLPSQWPGHEEKIIAWSAQANAGSEMIYSDDFFAAGAFPAYSTSKVLYPVTGYDSLYIFHSGNGNFNTNNAKQAVSFSNIPMPSADSMTAPAGMVLKGWRNADGSNFFQIGGSFTQSSPGVYHFYADWEPEDSRVKLTAPTNLEWHKYYSISLDQPTKTYRISKGIPFWDVVGAMSWRPGEDSNALTRNDYYVEVYKKGENGAADTRICYFEENTGDMTHYFEVYSTNYLLIQPDLESGTYYFTAYAIGDNLHYDNSDTVKSPEWEYVRPTSETDPDTAPRLAKMTNIIWTEVSDGLEVTWNIPDNAEEEIYTYQLNFERIEEPGSVQRRWGNIWASSYVQSSYKFSSTYASPGYWSFRIRAISKDMTENLNGEWSEERIYYVGERQNLLDGILESEKLTTTKDKVDEIRKLDTGLLAAALTEDTTNEQAAGKLAKLEENTGVNTIFEKDASIESPTVDPNGMSMIGAGLNLSAGSTVTMTVGGADSKQFQETIQKTVINTQTVNTVAFSMKISDANGEIVPAAGETRLDVPVKIIIPIPNDKISPQSLVVLHKHGEDDVEVIYPHVYSENNRWYASFTVMRFSDFMLLGTSGASKTDTGVIVSPGVAGSTYCAVYDEYDKMLAVSSSAVGGTYEITCSAQNAAYVKLFYLGEGNKPTREAVRYNLD